LPTTIVQFFETAPYHQTSVFDQPPHGTQTNTAAMAAPRIPAAPYVTLVAIAAFVEEGFAADEDEPAALAVEGVEPDAAGVVAVAAGVAGVAVADAPVVVLPAAG